MLSARNKALNSSSGNCDCPTTLWLIWPWFWPAAKTFGLNSGVTLWCKRLSHIFLMTGQGDLFLQMPLLAFLYFLFFYLLLSWALQHALIQNVSYRVDSDLFILSVTWCFTVYLLTNNHSRLVHFKKLTQIFIFKLLCGKIFLCSYLLCFWWI